MVDVERSTIPDESQSALAGRDYREASEPTLTNYVEAVWRSRVLILCITGAALLAATVSNLVALRSYEATTTLVVQPGEVDADRGATESVAAARVLLSSESAATQVIRELHLDDPPQNLTATAFLNNHLWVEAPAGTSFLRVHETLGDAQLAARAANQFAAAVSAVEQRGNERQAKIVLSRLEADLDWARARMDELAAQLIDHRRGQSDEDSQTIALQMRGMRLQQDHEAASKLYAELFTQAEKARLSALHGRVLITVVDEAVPNSAPVRPHKSLIVALATLAGLALSLALAVGRHFLEDLKQHRAAPRHV